MKKTPKRTVCLAAVCLLICTAAAGFRIREHGGAVAVWDCAASDWLCVTDVPVSSLPEADRKKLKNGIDVPTSGELSSILEDFCS